ncbi:hypothetical protein DH2020_004375 [Rehmannia glutinosa]|uniref:Iron-sulphur binding protein LdpA C-terminal domain-containing protein n=1 Tax=Rehmannia glutinosa TaxID=99300 RepID=A0ABR0XPZ6_REHGL
MVLSFSCCASLSPQLSSQLCARSTNSVVGLEKVKNLITKTGIPSTIASPLDSLQKGNWVKLICGASFEDVVDIRNLSLVYTLAGVDCIDCAAEASVVNAVRDGIEAARGIIPIRRPWVMISVNDNEDLHFRKAGAIPYIRDVSATAELLKQDDVDAIEIHTSGRQAESFQELWKGLGDSIDKLRLVAVSLPDIGELTIPAMNSMYDTMRVNLHCLNLWQLDGRPMSGDIGRGTTREAIKFALHLASIRDKPKGFLQLAGGTNAHTVEGLKREMLFQTTIISDKSNGEKVNFNSFESSHALISGVAFGGYARKIVGRVLRSLQSEHGYAHLEDYPDHLLKALKESLALVGTVKCYNQS